MNLRGIGLRSVSTRDTMMKCMRSPSGALTASTWSWSARPEGRQSWRSRGAWKGIPVSSTEHHEAEGGQRKTHSRTRSAALCRFSRISRTGMCVLPVTLNCSRWGWIMYGLDRRPPSQRRTMRGRRSIRRTFRSHPRRPPPNRTYRKPRRYTRGHSEQLEARKTYPTKFSE